MITVFTPTYNRAYILPCLYDSLVRQSNKNFEWVIVDDGSDDNTKELVDNWISENQIDIRYIATKNGGKHRAINIGAKNSKGDLFFIVDSDDYLTSDALEKVEKVFSEVSGNSEFAGVSGFRCYPNGNRIGGECNWQLLDCSPIDFRYKYRIKGDMAEVIRRDVLLEYPFPEVEGETFCPEAIFFNRISDRYKIRYFAEKIYVCDYLPDGLTAKITRLRMKNPLSSMICYMELAEANIPFVLKMKAIINYWRFYFCSNKKFEMNFHKVKYMTLLPIGWIMHLNDVRNDS